MSSATGHEPLRACGRTDEATHAGGEGDSDDASQEARARESAARSARTHSCAVVVSISVVGAQTPGTPPRQSSAGGSLRAGSCGG